MKSATKRILLIGDSLANGGAERVQAHLSLYFERQGWEVVHFLMHNEITYTYGGNCQVMPDFRTFLPLRLVKKWLFFKRSIKSIQPDYIIDFRFRHRMVQEFLLVPFLTKYTYIPSIRSSKLEWYLPKSRFLAGFLYRNAALLHTVSSAIAQKMTTAYGFTNVKYIPNPVMLSENETNISFSKPYILAVGRMNDDVKQFDHIIYAYANAGLRAKDIHLVILGTGAFMQTWQTFAEKLSISSHVHFMGFQSQVNAWMKQAEVLVLCSKKEGFPNVLIESLAQGTPVISYDCESGPSEIIENGRNGILVENQNKRALSEALVKYFEDENLKIHVQKNATESVKRFSLTAVGQAWEMALAEAHSRK